MVTQRGDIWFVALPSAARSHEQSGQRPAIVLQDESFGATLPLVLAVPLTSQISAGRFACTVVIPPTSTNGLDFPSVALVFQMRALDRARFIRKVGTLEEEMLASIFEELDNLTGR